MGASASKAAPSPDPLTNSSHDRRSDPSSENVEVKTTVDNESSQFPQPSASDDPIRPAVPITQEDSILSSKLTDLDPVVEQGDVESTSLPERLKFSPPVEAAIPLKTHKRFHSEEPEEPATPDTKADTEIFQTPAEFAAPVSSDESDAAPEVVSSVSRKSTNRGSTGRKRRRLEDVVVESKKLPDPDSIVATPTVVHVVLSQDTVNNNVDLGAAETRPNPYNVSLISEQTTTVTKDAVLERPNPASAGSEPNANPSLPAQTDGKISSLQSAVESENRSNLQSSSANMANIMPQPDAEAETETEVRLADSDFKVPLSTKPEPKISELNTVDIGNATALDDAESGSHTEAGSATLTNNSYVTVPEETSLGESVTINSASTNLQRKNSAENIPLLLPQQESCSKHMSGRPARPRKTMPAPPRHATALQDYKQRLLNRNPRTSEWGPSGFRRTRFVGA